MTNIDAWMTITEPWKTSLAFCVTTVALNVTLTVIVTESTVVNAHPTVFAMTVALACIITTSNALKVSLVFLTIGKLF